MESLDQEARLRGLVEKYRKNREKVPLRVLQTRYADAYRKLRRDILEASHQMTFRPPDWMWDVKPPVQTWEIMQAVFKRSFAEAGTEQELRKALFYTMDVDVAIQVVRRMNREAVAEWERYLDRTSKHVAWENGGGAPLTLRRYSPLLYSVKVDGRWQRLSEGYLAPDFEDWAKDQYDQWKPWMLGRDEA